MRRPILLSCIVAALAMTACTKPAEPAPAPTPPVADAADTQPAPAAEAMRAFGNEPFWEMVDIGGGKLRFSTPDQPDGEEFAASRNDDAAGIHYAGTDVKLDIVKKDCSDGMSDATHPWTATMTLRGKPYSGCAAPASDLTPVEDASPELATEADSSPVTRFTANGFSPAWRAQIDGDTVRLDVPEHARVDPGFTTVKATRAPYAKGAEYSGKDGDVEFVLTIDGRSRCEKAGDADGNTNREFNATLAYGNATYSGCADAVK